MKTHLTVLALATLVVTAPGCFLKKNKAKGLPDNGQLMGVAPSTRPSMGRPVGMVYVPQGAFHMGPSDEDVNFSYSARNKQVSINGFWMDATEITNNEYRQFTNWVRDSITAVAMNFVKVGQNQDTAIDLQKIKTIKYGSKEVNEKIADKLIVPVDDRLYGRMDLDPDKFVYRVEFYDLKGAAQREAIDSNGKINRVARNKYIIRYDQQIYPDTLVWMRDFAYSYNEPMTKRYYAHPSFGNYPVVGVSWKQAFAFCNWRTHILNSYIERKKRNVESDFRLPTEAEWEYAARGGRAQSPYPWGGPYVRNKKGCLLANFKPGRGNYPEDGGMYTVRADAYWPNDWGLYNMAGNVAEWTGSYFLEGGYNFQHDMNPDIRFTADDNRPAREKRKVVRGGSWKDTWYFLQTGTRTFEYQDTAKSYIGFRCVIDLPAQYKKP